MLQVQKLRVLRDRRRCELQQFGVFLQMSCLTDGPPPDINNHNQRSGKRINEPHWCKYIYIYIFDANSIVHFMTMCFIAHLKTNSIITNQCTLRLCVYIKLARDALTFRCGMVAKFLGTRVTQRCCQSHSRALECGCRNCFPFIRGLRARGVWEPRKTTIYAVCWPWRGCRFC